ncbi:MAG: efflux RND transporter periplasmic adaptor subunit [Candidatus Hydrogenedentes bacterium]|nr:efflux RND transporter periplasmic adaptor subunit [Candidatus Hydrogenedentota bacterium]
MRIVATFVLCGLIIGGGYAVSTVASRIRASRAQAATATGPAHERVSSVKVMILKSCTVEDRLVLTGGVLPWEDILISAETGGKIDWQGVKEGDRVEAGQELVRIDTRLLNAHLDQARAQEKLAAQESHRIQALAEKGVATTQASDKVAADKEMAAANLRLAEIQLQKSAVAAPIRGIVDKLFKDKDEFVDTGMPLVRLVQMDKVKVSVGVPEREVGNFAPDAPAVVTLDAIEGREFNGSIHKIATTADPSTLTFVTEIAVDNPDGVIKPGMVARVRLVRRVCPDSVTVPIFSVMTVENQRFVMVEDSGVARVRPIEIGIIQDDMVQAVTGLKPGDRLIVSGQRELIEGEPVQVAEVTN